VESGYEGERAEGKYGNTNVMRRRGGAGHIVKSGKYPCGVCSKGVGSNSSNVLHDMYGFIRNALASKAN